ncbi:RNA methyltransferase [Mangrovimonas sp. AS39]|uniref:RNA methyltransferase n=1 Tax=Mangrovimonas futianensis TaxID=2895523 RepID=UPI001E41BD2F|nr:RNA methyltransferase [Mangrovimonas futianensis]MCF1190772.1 RNA methyltransferase [Mangrovimonas futianensis]MCF1194469.1 RNA methyltransferase [Mangrovimonas futianensis]
MLSKNQIKLVASLKQKKYRNQHGLFVAEGIKTIEELLASQIKLYHLFTTESFQLGSQKETLITDHELKKISYLTTPNKALALFEIPNVLPLDKSQLIVAVDEVRDPGNLGTIIRLCDWFGIEHLVCSTGTVDCFNPKVIQATMGSIIRVNIHYLDLPHLLSDFDYPIFGAFMDGENVYSKALPSQGLVIMGNEANGISKEVEKFVTDRISIPRFGKLQETESLNVATATAILLSEFKRKS